MKPETEYIARQLASVVLQDRGDGGRLNGAGMGIVEIHLRGMERNIRQEILLDHVHLAGYIADEIERQTKGVDLEALVREKVAREIERAEAELERTIRQAVDRSVQGRIADVVDRAATAITADVVRRFFASMTEER